MSVSSTTNRVTFAGNGTTTAFAFSYFFVATSDLIVTTTDSSGVITTLSSSTDYVVSGTAGSDGTYPSGGTVTTTVAPAVGLTLSIVRAPSPTQATDFTDNVAEAAFDKVTLLIQRVLDLLGRAPKLPDGFVATFDPTLPTVMTASKVLAVNSSGNGFTLVPNASAGGTVTSVGVSLPAEFSTGSAITTSGNLSATWANQTTNKVLAAPNGSTGTPSFRSLVAADIPVSTLPVASMSSGSATINQVPVANGSGAISWQSITGTGTVTSVALSLPSILTVSGSPVTATGTLSATLASQSQNTFFSGPSGSSGTPSFRLMVGADLPALIGASSGSAGTKGAAPQPSAGDQVKFLRGDSTWAAVPAGTVTSVDLTTPSEFTVSGNPVTGAGTLAITKAVQAANKVWAGPTSGGSTAPAFRSLVSADLPSMTGASSIASGIAGAVPPPSAGQQTYFLRGDGAWAAASGSGGGSIVPTIITADYSIVPGDQFVGVNSAGTVNVTLPDAVANNGMGLAIKMIGGGTMNILTTSSQTIDGMSSLNISVNYTSINLIAANGGWYLL